MPDKAENSSTSVVLGVGESEIQFTLIDSRTEVIKAKVCRLKGNKCSDSSSSWI